MVVFEQRQVHPFPGPTIQGRSAWPDHPQRGQRRVLSLRFQHGIVTKRTLKGEEVFTLGYPAESDVQTEEQRLVIPYRPTNVAIAPNGDIYGRWLRLDFINQYNQKAEFIRTLWRTREGDYQLIAHTVCGSTR
jgi:hypothetical protein